MECDGYSVQGGRHTLFGVEEEQTPRLGSILSTLGPPVGPKSGF